MTTTQSLRNQIAILVLALLLTVLSYFYFDTWITLSVYRLLRASKTLTRVALNIPDLLPYIVVAITVICWTGYFILVHRGIRNRHTRFLQICGTAVPLAFIAKTGLQYLFGRPTPHDWVFHHKPARFIWFRGGAEYSCFPSGHMSVFTALVTTLSRYYSRYRRHLLGLLLLLALALIVTGHHYLSDVIAGACLGAIVAIIVDDGKSALNKLR